MLKREQETFQYMLDHEEEVIKALEKHYRDALHDINMSIYIMQGDELTQSKVYQLEYQKALKKQVEGILERMHAKEYTTIQQYLSDSYKDAFVGTMYSMHGQGIPIIATIDQNAAVKAVITDSKIKGGLYEHLAVGVDGMKKAIRQELTRGIASNMRYADIARNIESQTKAPLANTKNIVRTEGHRIQQASAHDARKVSQSKGADVVKQWDATLDGATRRIHRELDGKIVEVDEPFTHGSAKAMYPGDFGDPGLDCQCRCVALTRARWALDEAELETLKERAAYFKLDKTEDFQDFKKKYLKAAKEEADVKAEEKTPNEDEQKTEVAAEETEDAVEDTEDKNKNMDSAETLENAGESGIIKYGNYPEYSRIIDLAKTEIDDAKNTNPHYWDFTYEYMNNCQRCVPAWELRQRGYDVTAKPCKPIGEHDRFQLAPFTVWDYNPSDPDVMNRTQRDKEGNGKEKIIEFLKRCGNGARVEIDVEWQGMNQGHVFAAKNVNGNIVFVDPQTGASGEHVEEYFDRAVLGQTRWLRIDNKTLREQTREEVINNPYE